jgi:histone deacetylase complex regulatory component SIN3
MAAYDQQFILPRPVNSYMDNWSEDRYRKCVENFRAAVEETFAGDVGRKNTYVHFVEAATDFKEKRIEVAEWVELMKKLLHGDWWLLFRLANFLPLDYGDRLREEVLAKRMEETKSQTKRVAEALHKAINRGQDCVQSYVQSLFKAMYLAHYFPIKIEAQAQDQYQDLFRRIKDRLDFHQHLDADNDQEEQPPQQQQHVQYETFLQIVYMHEKGEKTREQMLEEVGTMLQTEHQDLLHEFYYFMKKD